MIEFIQFLEDLASSDNERRQIAEEKYLSLQNDSSDDLPLLLLNSMSNALLTTFNISINVYTRKLAAVLLRRLLIEKDESFYLTMTRNG